MLGHAFFASIQQRIGPHRGRWPITRLLPACFFLALLLSTHSIAFAHGGIGSFGSANSAPVGLTLQQAAIVLALAFMAGAAFVLLFHTELAGSLSAPVRIALSIVVITSAVAGGMLGTQQLGPVAFASDPTQNDATAHEADEGLLLGPADETQETVQPGRLCTADDPLRAYSVVAVDVEITLNRYLDYDPEGRMFVLESELARVRQEEAQNRDARAGKADPAVSLGLQGDAIQPLVLRVNQGECLRITMRNGTTRDGGEPVSFHLHGSSLYMVDSGAPAIASDPEALVAPGKTVTYAWWVPPDEQEGSHYFHSHGNTREQTNHGLFGVVIVEPRGSHYTNPTSGEDLNSGWEAIIEDPSGVDFREFAVIYHEIGTERYSHLDRNGMPVPLLDPYTNSYKPGGRALNYRSEPFSNRLELGYKLQGRIDNSLAYSSYSFGDPATPIMRSYLGDPVKQRVVHGGAEVFHVHHVHGGGIRWRRQPDEEPTDFASGLDKHPALLPIASERIDSQSIGPSESYDIENECGSGGCQQSVGDYLFHCHVAQHYISGMWGIWRVYNTLQTDTSAEDALPPLLELGDRKGHMVPAVTSHELVGTTVDWQGDSHTIDNSNLSAWVEQQLPPAGVPIGYDASVLDWIKDGDVYVNEAETDQDWPGYRSATPGIRPPLAFDPKTGKLAYPFLRPHLGQRPPFAPNHGPAPFLDPITQGHDPPLPGANGPWSLCPAGTKLKQFTVHAITLPLRLNARSNLVDPEGQLFVLKEDEDAVRADPSAQVPLAIRANAGKDCVDVLFKSELKDNSENHLFSKVSLHIHFVQFDVQASDGVTNGFNYEQSVRPFALAGETVLTDTLSGAVELRLSSAARFQPGILVGIGMDQDKTFEIRRITAVTEDTLRFDEPLQYDHAAGEIVSSEFLRQRWYPDVQFGTAYFHDHVTALTSWKHGLFGALIAEPPDATYHDPATGAVLTSGPIVDVRTDSVVSADVKGSFREMVLFIQDDVRFTRISDSAGSAINMRVEPLEKRGGDPAAYFSSLAHGDPETPLLQAYLGDPIVLRGLVPAANEVHTLHVDGHWFRLEPFSLTSPPINTVHLGISERYDLMIPRAGGPQSMPGDYLYYNGRTFKLREGSWGLIRVHDGSSEPALQKLPGHEVIPKPATSVCPASASLKRYAVAAIEGVSLPMLGSATGKIYVLEQDKEAVRAGTRAPEPLVLHVSVGDCIVVDLANELTDSPVSFHADMLAADPRSGLGVTAGYNLTQTVAPGASGVYTFFAHPEVGETVALVRDWGDVLTNPGLGLYGAIVVGPAGATYTDPVTGADLASAASWRVDVHPPSGPSYRDFTLLMQDEDVIIGNAVMPYSEHVAGVVGLNYRAESLLARLENNPDPALLYDSSVHGDPSTPLLEAYAGDNLHIHVLAPFNEQAHVFSLEGHQWPLEPGRIGTDLLSSVQVGALESVTLIPQHGAGGAAALPGDYLYGDHREPYREAGLWGYLRVYAPDRAVANLLQLPQ